LGTIEKHLSALESENPALLAAYRELGLQTVPIALARGGIHKQKAEEMRALFMGSRYERRHSEGVPMESERPNNLASKRLPR
jgi:hypothetical protein